MPRRQLGRHLRDLRNRARLIVRTAAHALEWSETKLWRIETGYARTLIRAGLPEADEEEIGRRVHMRITRQALLTRVTAVPVVKAAFNEAVLRRSAGGPAVMARQLDRLVETMRSPCA